MTCNEHREEEQFAAYCPFCLAKYWEGYAHKIKSERDRLRKALTSAHNLLSDFTTGDVYDPIDMAVDILSAALQEAGDD